MFFLNPTINYFPHPLTVSGDNIAAFGGDLEVDRLLLAYQFGYFPWFNPDEPILWWHPDPRFIMRPKDIKVSKSMRPYFNQHKFSVTLDQCFDRVIKSCQKVKRKNEEGTWISQELIYAYTKLHRMGYAHSIEVWNETKLVGGLYGVSLGKVFYGESMFAKEANASKFGYIVLARLLQKEEFHVIDCQMPTEHLRKMGGSFMERTDFYKMLKNNIFEPTIKGNWQDHFGDIDLSSLNLTSTK